MVVKYCFCLYWLWIATYRNKWIYLKIHILRLSLFYILLTFFNLNFNSQTHFHCSSSSGVSDLALIRIPARQKTRKSDLLPTERDKLNCLTKTFFSFTHFFFYCTLRPRQEAHTEQMTSCPPRVPRKNLSEGQGVQIFNTFPSFLSVKLWQKANNKHPSKYHSAETLMRPFAISQF